MTMGGTCVAHDPVDTPAYPDGVPSVRATPGFVMTTQREVRSRVPIG